MRVLLVDDEPMSRHGVAFFLRMAMNCEVVECEDGAEALARFQAEPFPVVISDIRMPRMDGLELLQALRALPQGLDCAVILMTGFADVDSAVTALRRGAYDYLHKPVKTETLAAVLAKWNQERESRVSHPTAAEEAPRPVVSQTLEVPGYGAVGIFSPVLRRLVELAFRLHEDRTLPVLIQGETGTGKEVFARLVHHGRRESTRPFVSLNCPAIAPTLFESELFGYEAGAFTGARKTGSPGKLELAQGGTLFLDEIGDLPLDLQPKLLRVLQEREMYRVGGASRVALDVRLVAATNRDLGELAARGKFRQDLYYRLNLGLIQIPPLRERREEIPHLAQMILARLAEEKRRAFRYLSAEARALLTAYPWPGNVRELHNALERVALLYDEESVRPEHLAFLAVPGAALPADAAAPLAPDNFTLPEEGLDLDALNEAILRRALEKFGGNKTRAAEYLGLTRSSIRKRAAKL
ncbi:MAG: sigma-54-dependent Fis family transcriptional regulator [Candidatus Zixiibacteriota bacterium]|nr:MAG: sigma-54-dependent Fis family transcriptional regulator [candidate division Zixibacteria bacterium]